jgi:hypothetical protein
MKARVSGGEPRRHFPLCYFGLHPASGDQWTIVVLWWAVEGRNILQVVLGRDNFFIEVRARVPVQNSIFVAKGLVL